MSTYEMLIKSIESKINRDAITQEYIDSTKIKLDVFLTADRITVEEFTILTDMLNNN